MPVYARRAPPTRGVSAQISHSFTPDTEDTACQRALDAAPEAMAALAALNDAQRAAGKPVAGYEDVNDAERLRHDPAMRWIVEIGRASCRERV